MRERTLVFDGAMGTQIQAAELTAGDFGGKEGANDYLTLTRPDVIERHPPLVPRGRRRRRRDQHLPVRRASARGVGARASVTYEINHAAAALARRAADDYATARAAALRGRLDGPDGHAALGATTRRSRTSRFDELAELFGEQAAALVDGGVDVLLIETAQDILEARAAIHGARRAFGEPGGGVPIQAQVALDTTGRMLLGTDIAAGADDPRARCAPTSSA